METTSFLSANRPPPPPASPPPRFGDTRPNFEPFEQELQETQEQPSVPYMYYDPPAAPEPEKTFMESISKKVLFVIFLAFIAGLFVGKFMSQTTVVNLSKHI
jgi:hypothetical protein